MENLEFNKVYHCDVLELLSKIPDKSIEFVWGDPDYNVGINYDGADYTMEWHVYNDWYKELAKQCMRVLTDNGNAFFMNYPKQNSYLAVNYLYENSYDLQEYAWIYNISVGNGVGRFTTAHRTILHARNSDANIFLIEGFGHDYATSTHSDKRVLKRGARGSRNPLSWFYFDLVKNVSKEKTFHPCQVPQVLYQKFLNTFTHENNKCLILFGGSGGEIVVTEEANRQWLSAELHEPYVNLINSRLESIRKQKKLF